MKLKRSSTLFEVLVALALLAGLLALILPTFMKMVDERAFESAADVTDDQLQMARTHSQTTQTPVEVVYHANPPRLEARLFQPWANDDGGNITSGAEDFSMFADSENGHGKIDEAWASRTFGRGISITRAPTERGWGVFGSESNEDDAQGSGGGFVPGVQEQIAAGMSGKSVGDIGSPSDDIRLAVFMPDGSAVVGDAVMMQDESGRKSKLVINPWTGVPAFVRQTGERDADSKTHIEEDDEAETGRTYDRGKDDSARGRENRKQDGNGGQDGRRN
ncbi:MAG TPA: hypothetical protein VG711_03445 [Phycisphaerales bacterium]|nr:hypothetical protein [Phycisphaerales bacterium]